ncbi:MAG: PAS domain S-box protein [Armatimonadetes bacterium]|nr:PAS domain S-box protein [Armatimonadota bacterium]
MNDPEQPAPEPADIGQWLRAIEIRQQAILTSALDCIITIDHHSRILEWNPAAERTFGYARVEALGASLPDLIIPPAFRERHQQGVAHYLQTGEGPLLGRRVEVNAVRADGVEIAVELAITPIAEGSRPLFTAYLRDITERKAAEQALQESLARYRFLADAMPQIVWTARPDGSLDYYNRRWYEYTGLAVEQTQGWGWEPVLHPDDLPPCIDRWTQAVRSGEAYEIEYRLKRASDGTYRWHLGRAFPLRDALGVIVQWVGTCTDIDDQKRAEEALQAATVLQRAFLRDVLASVTEGRLRLCDDAAQLPPMRSAPGPAVPLSRDDLRTLRARVRDAACELNFPDPRWLDLVTSVGEAAMNAVVHGGGGQGRICADAETLQVWIEDRGAGIALDRLPQATLERGYTTAGTFGHGFWLMLQTVDRVFLLTGPAGTVVVLEQDCTPPTPAWLADFGIEKEPPPHA